MKNINRVPDTVIVFSLVVMIAMVVYLTVSIISVITPVFTLFSPSTGVVFSLVLIFYSLLMYRYL